MAPAGRIASVLLALVLLACGGEDTAVPAAGEDADSARAYPFEGRWALDSAACDSEEGDARIVRLTSRRFEQLGNSCDVDRIVDIAAGTEQRFLVSCSSATGGYAEDLYLRVSGETLLIEPEEGASTTLFRCGDAR